MILHEFWRKTRDNVIVELKIDACFIHFCENVAGFFHVDTVCVDHNQKTGASPSLKGRSTEEVKLCVLNVSDLTKSVIVTFKNLKFN